MILKKLKVGMDVYDCKKVSGIHEIMHGEWCIWTVHIIEIDEINKRVKASHSVNEPEWYEEPIWKKWRLNPPN